MVKIIHNHVIQFPRTETGNEQLLQTYYDYMDAFKQVINSTSQIQMDYICQQYDGFYRFAKLMEMLAYDTINIPRDH
ncbi:arylsulfatase regulator [Photorhabdus luminescens subsp. mexicana]|uniref:Arylsulfatase regulator n=2 Tax=Photorhabdus luminescens TaxID=29488 RepID=A0A4R4J5H8_PHOLU|nr:arylsulfatase regulator [Photorhabdus luminescens]TDB47939.1 arylsulfatase regulator [Photorhabdus luminescens subsp. mexicana]